MNTQQPDHLQEFKKDMLRREYAAPVQEPVAKLQVTLQDRPIDIELAQYKRMFESACSALGAIGDALGCDPEEGGAEPILAAIAELKATPPSAQPAYDQTALELCDVCGWKTLIPGDVCLNCEHEAAAQPALKPLTDEQIDAEHDKLFPPTIIPGARARVREFARAIEKAHGITGEQNGHR